MRRVSAIVLAAGKSTRFGGPNKVLADWNGRPMVRCVVDALVDVGLPVTVVTGRDADLVASTVSPANAVVNPRYEEGMGTSLACGVASLADADGFLIALADMPDLRAEVVEQLLSAFEAAESDAIVVPVYSDEPDRFGHPVIFASCYREALQSLSGDQGARAILREHTDRVIKVPVAGLLRDLDSPDASPEP